ncbi:MAG: alpha/beta fold hydrolase, partial [Acidobacteriota bacterium]
MMLMIHERISRLALAVSHALLFAMLLPHAGTAAAGIDPLRSQGARQPAIASGSSTLDTSAQSRDIELTFASGSLTLGGTLTLPAGRGPFPAIVLLTGSGPQNRDEEIFGFRPFLVLATHLAQQGIAVLRYDDRGVGSSSGSVSNSTTSDFADDARAALALLAARPEIDKRRLGLLGHSEGAVVAALVAAQSPEIAFVVLMAPPAVRGSVLLRRQAVDAARLSGAT